MQQERIGDFLRQQGVITEEEIGLILSYSQQTGLRFCEAGLEIKILTQDKLVRAFAPGFKGDLFNVSASHLTKDATSFLTIEEVLRHGALPLGFRRETRILGPARRKILNLGMLDPFRNKEVVEAIHARVATKRRNKPFHSANVYLVLVDQFIEAIHTIYGVTEDQIREMDRSLIDPTLARFLRIEASQPAKPKLRLAS